MHVCNAHTHTYAPHIHMINLWYVKLTLYAFISCRTASSSFTRLRFGLWLYLQQANKPFECARHSVWWQINYILLNSRTALRKCTHQCNKETIVHKCFWQTLSSLGSVLFCQPHQLLITHSSIYAIALRTPKALTMTTFSTHITTGLVTEPSPWQEEEELILLGGALQ